jgi:hypothetical protein
VPGDDAVTGLGPANAPARRPAAPARRPAARPPGSPPGRLAHRPAAWLTARPPGRPAAWPPGAPPGPWLTARPPRPPPAGLSPVTPAPSAHFAHIPVVLAAAYKPICQVCPRREVCKDAASMPATHSRHRGRPARGGDHAPASGPPDAATSQSTPAASSASGRDLLVPVRSCCTVVTWSCAA